MKRSPNFFNWAVILLSLFVVAIVLIMGSGYSRYAKRERERPYGPPVADARR